MVGIEGGLKRERKRRRRSDMKKGELDLEGLEGEKIEREKWPVFPVTQGCQAFRSQTACERLLQGLDQGSASEYTSNGGRGGGSVYWRLYWIFYWTSYWTFYWTFYWPLNWTLYCTRHLF